MPKTDRTKHPECRHCKRTIEIYRVDPYWDGRTTSYITRWVHRKSGKIACTPLTRNKIAAPPDDYVSVHPPQRGRKAPLS